MKQLHSQTNVVAHAINAAIQLRKVKLYPSVRAVTVVAYYKDRDRQAGDYIGRAYCFDWKSLRAYTTMVIHNNHTHAPPTDEEDQEDEIELAPPGERLPAIGY